MRNIARTSGVELFLLSRADLRRGVAMLTQKLCRDRRDGQKED